MMGSTTLREVKDALCRAFKMNEAELKTYLKEEMAKGHARKSSAANTEKELTRLLKILCEVVKEKRPKAGMAKKTPRKKLSSV